MTPHGLQGGWYALVLTALGTIPWALYQRSRWGRRERQRRALVALLEGREA